MKQWQLDVKVQSNPYMVDINQQCTTGGILWPAAKRLVEFLSNEDLTGCKTILELGAGLGYLGLSVARNIQAQIVCLTEQAEGGALDWLRHNVDKNKDLPNSGAVHTCECDWRDYAWAPPDSSAAVVTSLNECSVKSCSLDSQQQGEDSAGQQQEHTQPVQGVGHPCCSNSSKDADQSFLTSTHWDLVIGSDLVYNEVGSKMLPQVLRSLSSPSTVILYCHTKHRYDHLDVDLFEQLDRNGFHVQEVREPWLPSPPPSPPPLTELFPEQRIVIFRIALKH